MQIFRLSQALRRQNLITDDNRVKLPVKEIHDYRKFLHRMKIDDIANVKRDENANDLNLQRVKISNRVFNKIYKNKDKFAAIYCNGINDNPCRLVTVRDMMFYRKLDQENQRTTR